ncbi:hypothetical protein SLS61_008760 [Didymella pomorum]
MVNFLLSTEQRALRATVSDFAHDVLSTAPKLYDDLPTQTTRFRSTLPIYRSAVSAGLIKGQVPVPYGGESASMLDAAIVVEELYAVEPSTALTILGTGLGLTPLILAANEEQRQRFLTPFTRTEGERLASFVHSEPGGTANWLRKGSPGLQTTAFQDGDEWVVNGEKLWTTNSGGWDSRGADVQCVVCRQGRPNEPQDPAVDPSANILMLVITREDITNNAPGAYEVLSDPELGGHKSTSGPHTRFTNLRVPAANLLAKPGEGAKLVEKTFGMSAAIVGAIVVYRKQAIAAPAAANAGTLSKSAAPVAVVIAEPVDVLLPVWPVSPASELVAVADSFSSPPVSTSAYVVMSACDIVMGDFASSLNAAEFVHHSGASCVVCAVTVEKDWQYADIFDSAPI